MIQRYSRTVGGPLVKDNNGDIVFYTDHLAALEAAVQRERQATTIVSFQKQERIEILEAAVKEKDEWIDRLEDGRIVTCVYCGHAYPPETQRSKRKILYEHIKLCPKHPLRHAEEQIATLIAELDAWKSVFGTTQLTHAQARLEQAEKANAKRSAQAEALRKIADLDARLWSSEMITIAQAALKSEKENDIIEDGFGSSWSAYCAMCGKKTMQVVRPGKVQCADCG